LNSKSFIYSKITLILAFYMLVVGIGISFELRSCKVFGTTTIRFNTATNQKPKPTTISYKKSCYSYQTISFSQKQLSKNTEYKYFTNTTSLFLGYTQFEIKRFLFSFFPKELYTNYLFSKPIILSGRFILCLKNMLQI
jgi:hypothetical protein